MKKFKSKYLILISLLLFIVGLIIYYQINSKKNTENIQTSNTTENQEQIHFKKKDLITIFIEKTLNSLHKIKLDLPDDDNLNSLEQNLLDQKNLINKMDSEWLSLDLSLKDINDPNDIIHTFQTNPEFEQNINSLKEKLNFTNDKENILENILKYLNKIKSNTNIGSSDNSHIDNSALNPLTNQTEQEIMDKIKDLKNKCLNDCEISFSDWTNFKNAINNSSCEQIKIQSEKFKFQNIKKQKKEQKLKIIETLEKELISLFPNLNELNTNQQAIILPVQKNNLLYQDISVNCDKIKQEIQKLKQSFDIQMQNLNQQKEINLKNNVIICIELLSILKEKNYDLNIFKNDGKLRQIFYLFNNSENINLQNIFHEYLKVIKNNF